MLPKKERLKKGDFLNPKPKKTIRGVYTDISFSPEKETKYSCVISKKRIKEAVLRNKVRRRIYAILKEVSLKKPYHIILYPKNTILKTPYPQIKSEIKELFDTL